MAKLKPGDINNYAFGYQDCTGFGGKQLENPRLPDDETYMSGWFSGLKALSVENFERAVESFRLRKKKEHDMLLIEWNKWRKLHDLEPTRNLPL